MKRGMRMGLLVLAMAVIFTGRCPGRYHEKCDTKSAGDHFPGEEIAGR